jgi:hypothetical protein
MPRRDNLFTTILVSCLFLIKCLVSMGKMQEQDTPFDGRYQYALHFHSRPKWLPSGLLISHEVRLVLTAYSYNKEADQGNSFPTYHG